MEKFDETMVAEALDLGSATVETRGAAPVGIYDSETNLYFLQGGIDQND